MAALPKLGSPALARALLAVWSGGKTVDWCRYFQYLYSNTGYGTPSSPLHICKVWNKKVLPCFLWPPHQIGPKSILSLCSSYKVHQQTNKQPKSINKQPSNQSRLSISLQSPRPNNQTSNIFLKSARSPTIIISDWIKSLTCRKRDLTVFKVHKVSFNPPSKVFIARPCVV